MKTELLNELICFLDDISQCKVTLQGTKVVSEYKTVENRNAAHMDHVFSELGFEYIKVRKYTEENEHHYYTVGFENGEAGNVYVDFSNRFDRFKSIKSMVCRRIPMFSEKEISACLLIIMLILDELQSFTVNSDYFFQITEEQKEKFSGSDNIYQFNSIFVPYIINNVHSHKSGERFDDEEFFSDLFEYLFKVYYIEESPLEFIGFGECQKGPKTVYGLKLRNKDYMLSDFIDLFCSHELLNLLYKKEFVSRECLAECISFSKIIISELETKVSETNH
ncbi:MAG: hypothetical protein Q4F95_09460 [Oscillospiraceae bacterium]|nr:hypothetical protein [Oscillospiraceae bacterium]